MSKIAKSLENFGWTSPILIDGANEIIAGHGRVLAAKQLGMELVPCIRILHLTPELITAYRIADNRLAIDSEWDDELLTTVLADLRLDPDFDISLTGFDDDELNRFTDLGGSTEGEDETPALGVAAVSQIGDVWEMGKHRLICGDCTDSDIVSEVLCEAKPNLMVTDPPYGVEYDADWRAEAGINKNKLKMGAVLNDDRADWSPAWALFKGSIAYVWCASLRNDEVIASLEVNAFERRSQIIWAKDRFALSQGHYHWKHEPCWYAVRKGATANWVGDRSQTTVWNIDARDDEGHGHSTQKPVECMRRPILNHTIEGDEVYDPFMGSGTTLCAAELTKRVAYGCELNPLYVDMAVRRWQTLSGKAAKLAGDGRTFSEVENARSA